MKSDGILLAARRNKFFPAKGEQARASRQETRVFCIGIRGGGEIFFLAHRIYYHLELMPGRK